MAQHPGPEPRSRLQSGLDIPRDPHHRRLDARSEMHNGPLLLNPLRAHPPQQRRNSSPPWAPNPSGPRLLTTEGRSPHATDGPQHLASETPVQTLMRLNEEAPFGYLNLPPDTSRRRRLPPRMKTPPESEKDTDLKDDDVYVDTVCPLCQDQQANMTLNPCGESRRPSQDRATADVSSSFGKAIVSVAGVSMGFRRWRWMVSEGRPTGSVPSADKHTRAGWVAPAPPPTEVLDALLTFDA